MGSDNKLTNITSIIVIMTFIVTAILSITYGQWKILFISFLAIGCIALIFIIDYFFKRKKIILPPRFALVSILFIFLALFLGEIIALYSLLWWWDLLLHFIAGIYFVIISLYLMQDIIKIDKVTTIKRYTILTLIFAFSFSITFGTLWEEFEFIGDYFFKTTIVKWGLEDTMTDLLLKIIGAFITTIIYFFRKIKYYNV